MSRIRVTWPPTLWIGGAPGAGKSTIARALAQSHDLPLHPIDLWAYDHQGRVQPGPPLDQVLARGPEAAADVFEAESQERIPLVVEDLLARNLGEIPAVVEGPQLFPWLADQLPQGHGVWLIPEPARTRAARAGRADAAPGAAPAERLEALVKRDGVLAARVRQAARERGLAVIEVSAQPDWSEIRRAVRHALPALTFVPRLAAGEPLARQRRVENRAAARQGELWQQATALLAPPAYPFACECGRSGCRGFWIGTPQTYADRAARGRVTADAH